MCIANDYRTGVLTTTAQLLDKEVLCDVLTEECVVSFDVVVQPYFKLVKVKVEVRDVNDHVPRIELVDGGVQLYESAEIGTELYLGTARDTDSLVNGIESCHLQNTRSTNKTIFNAQVQKANLYSQGQDQILLVRP